MNHNGAEKGYLKQDMNNVNQDVTMNLTNVEPGHHMLKYYATNQDGTLFAQDVLNLMLEGMPQPEIPAITTLSSRITLPLIKRAP
jgi:chitin-binding protein